MKYMLLICEDRSLPERDEAANASLMAQYAAFTQEIIGSPGSSSVASSCTGLPPRRRCACATVSELRLVSSAPVVPK